MANDNHSEFLPMAVVLDCDGVLLDTFGVMKTGYEQFTGKSFSQEEWWDINRDYDLDPSKYKDFGVFFSNSEAVRDIPPVEGMPELIRDLRDAGFDLFVLTSIEPDGAAAREENLRKYFGDAFLEVHCVGKASKAKVLAEYIGKYQHVGFVDDSVRHVKEAAYVATQVIWFDIGYLSHRADEMDEDIVDRARNVDELRRLLL